MSHPHEIEHLWRKSDTKACFPWFCQYNLELWKKEGLVAMKLFFIF